MTSMGFGLAIVFSCAVLVLGAPKFQGKQIPNYISPCKLSDPELSKCAVQHALKAIPRIVKGDNAYNVRILDPFHLEEVNLSPNKDLSLLLTDADFFGLTSVEIKNINIDTKKKHIRGDLYAKLFTIIGKYNISGQILFLPIRGNGPIKLEFENCDFSYSFDYDVKTQDDGKLYMTNIRPHIEYTIGNARYRLDNLFDGNKQLGENVNKVLNDNSKEVLNEFGLVVKEIIKLVALQPVQGYLTTVPYNVIFPQ